MIDRPGIYPDMLAAEYFADPCPAPSLTQSLAKVLLERSPLHAKCEHPRLRDPTPEDEDEAVEPYVKAKAIGSAAHALMLGRGKVLEVREYDSWRGKASAERAEIAASGKEPILSKHFDIAVKMVQRGREQLFAGGFSAFDREGGSSEVCLAWEEDGLWFRSLIDWLPSDTCKPYDYKTTGMPVAPHLLPRLMVDADWCLQAAMHSRGLDILDPAGAGRRKFRFVAQENTEPYALVVCELTEAVMTLGRKKLDMAIRLWRTCMHSGQWPGYPSDLLRPEYPSWAEAGWLAREVAEADAARSEPVNTMLAG